MGSQYQLSREVLDEALRNMRRVFGDEQELELVSGRITGWMTVWADDRGVEVRTQPKTPPGMAYLIRKRG